MFRGERPIKPGNSWFSAKTIEVVPRVLPQGVEHWMDAGVARSTNSNQTPNTCEYSSGDRRRVLRSVVKRETALTYS